MFQKKITNKLTIRYLIIFGLNRLFLNTRRWKEISIPLKLNIISPFLFTKQYKNNVVVVPTGATAERINPIRTRSMLFVRDQNTKEGGGGEGLVHHSPVCSIGDEKVCTAGPCVTRKLDRRP